MWLPFLVSILTKADYRNKITEKNRIKLVITESINYLTFFTLSLTG